MTSTLPALDIRRRLGKKEWKVPVPFGPDGWIFDTVAGRHRIIVTVGPTPDGTETWWHASISGIDEMPTYEDLVLMHHAVWPAGWAYQVFAPPESHVNIHEYVLHLWGKPDGLAVLPNFGANGTI